VLTFVKFGSKQLTHSLFSSHKEVNVRQNNVRMLYTYTLSQK